MLQVEKVAVHRYSLARANNEELSPYSARIGGEGGGYNTPPFLMSSYAYAIKILSASVCVSGRDKLAMAQAAKHLVKVWP